MRKLTSLLMSTAIMVFLAATASANVVVTIDEWAVTPVQIGDKLFTLISTSFEGDGKFVVRYALDLYSTSLQPRTDFEITDETETLVYRVEVVDDPSTPDDESLLYYISRVNTSADLWVVNGTFTVDGVFDDSADFGSPLATFSNNGESWGPADVAGYIKELYVSLTFTAAGSTFLFSYTPEFLEEELPIAAETTSWSQIKDLF